MSYYLARRTLEPIEEAMDAQTQFVSDASHELRTPHGATHIKRSSTSSKKLTLSDAKRTIQENLDEVDRLQQLTDGLLRLLSRDSQVQIIDFKLQDAIGTALAAVAPKATSKRIAVNDQTPRLPYAPTKEL